MPKTTAYVDREESAKGGYTWHCPKDLNSMLDLYCKINGINKSVWLTGIVRAALEERFQKLKEN